MQRGYVAAAFYRFSFLLFLIHFACAAVVVNAFATIRLFGKSIFSIVDMMAIHSMYIVHLCTQLMLEKLVV